MRDSETFGVEEGAGERVVAWLNEEAGRSKARLEARLYGYVISTENFGAFEMFSWRGNVQSARKMIIRASKRFKVRVIEGGYKTKEKTLSTKKSDYAMVRRGERIIGRLHLEAPLFGRSDWSVKEEERR